MDRLWLGVFRRKNLVQSRFDGRPIAFEEIGECHATGWIRNVGSAAQPCGLGMLRRFIFGLKRLRRDFAVCLFEENFDAPFCFFELLLTLA